MTKDEALKLALKALETNNKAWKHLADSGDAGFWEAEEQPFYELSVQAITAVKEALAQPEQPKVRTGNCLLVGVCASEGHKIAPQRKPLTDEEIYDMYNEPRSDAEMIAFAKAIEAAHGIKGEA